MLGYFVGPVLERFRDHVQEPVLELALFVQTNAHDRVQQKDWIFSVYRCVMPLKQQLP